MCYVVFIITQLKTIIKCFCEICGLNNQIIYDCKKCLAWNYGPKLCVTQDEDSSFFYINECVDSRVSKEIASTTDITIVSREVSTKQIEHHFMNLIGSDTWRWTNRCIEDQKFMRFPLAKTIQRNLRKLLNRSNAIIMRQIRDGSNAPN